jgi:hypothetical protein
MGLDLALLPFEAERDEWGFSHSILQCERDQLLFDHISNISGESVPKRFATYLCSDDAYEEPHYGNTQRTPYDEPLTWVRVEELIDAYNAAYLHDTPHPRNRAVWSYLSALPARTKIALYWH